MKTLRRALLPWTVTGTTVGLSVILGAALSIAACGSSSGTARSGSPTGGASTEAPKLTSSSTPDLAGFRSQWQTLVQTDTGFDAYLKQNTSVGNADDRAAYTPVAAANAVLYARIAAIAWPEPAATDIKAFLRAAAKQDQDHLAEADSSLVTADGKARVAALQRVSKDLGITS